MLLKKQLLIMGTNATALYHPLSAVEKSLKKTLKKHFRLSTIGSLYELEGKKLEKFSVILSYCDLWEHEIEDNHIKILEQYIQNGGSLLVLHTGFSLQENNAFIKIIGAKFTGHPPYGPVSYSVINPNHPITAGIKDFSMNEELYLFILNDSIEKNILITSHQNTNSSPALWTSAHGQGKIVYLAPGHDNKTFTNTVFQQLLSRCALWAAGKI